MVLTRSLELMKVPDTGGVRLRLVRPLGASVRIEVEVAASPGPGETTTEADGLRFFLPDGLEASLGDITVDVVDPHERVVVRGSRA